MECALEGGRQGVTRGRVGDEVATKRPEKKRCDVRLLLQLSGGIFMLVLLGLYSSAQVTDQEVIHRFHFLSTEAFIIGLTNLVVVGVLLMLMAMVFP